MSTIHQIYCTHCTHGTSALERREGELRDRMLGYSARAGSLEARHLRRYYRQIERYVYYYLPRDTPSDQKLRLTARSAPRRLVYHPSTGGLQVVGQICYRQTDTQGRPGSYFAHVLFRDEKDDGPRFSPLDCLKLWAAPGWMEEDSSRIPFLLEPLASLDQMLAGRRSAVDDEVFLSFLSTPAGGSFDDPAGMIPERWRQMDAAARCRLFVEAFRVFLDTQRSSPTTRARGTDAGGTRRESLLLVIEPSVAALVFYGILRLLPAGGIREAVSFSTFEPNTDRVGTSLAATMFYDPQKTDLRPDAYRSHAARINTFTGRKSPERWPQARYAPTMVRRLLEEGWEAVDWSLASIASTGARRPEDLDALAAVDGLLPALFDPRGTRIDDEWRRSAMATGYLRQAVVRELNRWADPYAALEPLVGRPAHLTILELIAAELLHQESPGTRRVAAFLLERLPGESIADLLKLGGVSVEAKLDVLVRYVTSHHQLPPRCDHLWTEPPWAAGRRGAEKGVRNLLPERPVGCFAQKVPDTFFTGAIPGNASGAMPPGPLLPRLLARLDLDTLEKFYRHVAPQHSDAFLASLASAWKTHECGQGCLTQVVQAVDDEALLSLFRTHGTTFFQQYPDDEPALRAKLHGMVDSLLEHVRQFPERLDLILAARHLLPDEDQDVVTAWVNCRQAILEVGRLQDHKWGVLRQGSVEELEAACRRMAEAARKAMPPGRLDDDRQGSQKQTRLRQVGKRLLGGTPLLPGGIWQHHALWQKIAWYFQNRHWPGAPLKNMRPKGRPFRPNWLILCTIVALMLVVVAFGRWWSSDRSAPNREAITSTANPAGASPVPATAGNDSTERTARIAQATAKAERPAPLRQAATKAARERHTARQAEGKREVADQTAFRAPVTREAARPETPSPPPAARMQEATLGQAEQAATQQSDEQATLRPAEATAPKVSGPQVAMSQANEAATIGHTRPQADAWKRQAEQFAREHAGKFFDEAPLVNGELLIPADALPDAPDAGGLFLGDGFLHCDHAVFAFGTGFDSKPPVSRHEIPELARVLEVPSVYVELQARPSGSAIVLGIAPLEEHNRQGSATLREQCRRISVVVYRAVEGGDVDRRSAGPGAAPHQTVVEPTPVADALKLPGARFKVEPKPARRLNPPGIAQIRPIVVTRSGKRLPSWYDEQIVGGCRIVEQDADGLRLRTILLGDILAEKSAEVFRSTTAVRVRFEFHARDRTPAGKDPRTPIAAASHVIPRIEEGKQYTVKLVLSQEALDWLRLLAGEQVGWVEARDPRKRGETTTFSRGSRASTHPTRRPSPDSMR